MLNFLGIAPENPHEALIYVTVPSFLRDFQMWEKTKMNSVPKWQQI